MKAMPLPAGIPSISLLQASRPPAEAPIPTTAKSLAPRGGLRAAACAGSTWVAQPWSVANGAAAYRKAFKALVISAASVEPIVAVALKFITICS